MKFRPIKKTRAYEQVIERIIESIEQGKILPGERLPSERELAEQLSISRSVIREAMSILHTSNIIDIKPGIGIFLMQDDKEDLLKSMNKVLIKDDGHVIELLEVRQGLEVQSAYLAAQRASKKDLADIYSALVNLEEAVSKKMIAAEEDYEFHLAIGRASQNEMIIELLHLLSERYLESLKKTRSELKRRNKVEEFIKEHREMYNAIASGDAQKARELMSIHIENTIDFHLQIKDD